MFENRATYRLLHADLATPRCVLRFGRGPQFDSINSGEAAAHEYAASHMGHPIERALRDAIGDPCDLALRPVYLAISILTMRHDRTDKAATFLLHWRDPTEVGHAGQLYQVVPVGIFPARW